MKVLIRKRYMLSLLQDLSSGNDGQMVLKISHLNCPILYVSSDSAVLFFKEAAHSCVTIQTKTISFHAFSSYTAGKTALIQMDEMYRRQAGTEHPDLFTRMHLWLSGLM